MATSMNLHGTTLEYNDLDNKFPRRNAFLNSALIAEDLRLLNESKEILFYPNDISEKYAKVNGNYRYHIVLAGILPSGLKTVLSLLVEPYFYIRVPDEYLSLDVLADTAPSLAYAKVENFRIALEELFSAQSIYFAPAWEIVRKYQSDGVQRLKGFYIKVKFYTLGHRKKAINLISMEANRHNERKCTPVLGHYCHTANDDLTCYYRMAAREYRNKLCGWNTLATYTINNKKDTVYGTFNGEVFLEGNFADLLSYDKPLDRDELKRDNSIVAAWDIECSRGANDGAMPNGEEPTDEVFMIGITFAYYWSKTSFLRVCITSRPTDILPNDLTIQCSNQNELCRAFAIIMGKMQPEFIAGFNDGDFDWPFMVEKVHYYGLLEYWKKHMSVLYHPTELPPNVERELALKLKRPPKHSDRLTAINDRIMGTAHRMHIPITSRVNGIEFEHQKTKLDPDTYADTYSLKFFGYIPIDVRCLFRSLLNNPEQSSLNYFLTINNLQQKEDLPIVELFEIYNRMQDAIKCDDKKAILIEASNMARAKSYCITDAESCHRLMLKMNIIMDKRNISTIAYTSMHDAIYRADGMKVRNYVMSDAAMRNTLYSNISQYKDSDDKYPGAYVVPPKKGMQCSKLSIDERIKAAKENVKYPYHNSDDNYSAWGDVTDASANKMKAAVARFLPMLKPIVGENDTDRNLLYISVINEMRVESDLDPEEINLLFDMLKEWTGRPVSGLDFASLYPSIMMAYNLSKETIIRPDYNDPQGLLKFEAKADRLRNLGYTLHYIEFSYGSEGRDRIIRGYSIRHTYDPSDANADPVVTGFGIFPTILLSLMEERKKIKKLMNAAGKIIEETENRISTLEIEKSLCVDMDDINKLQQSIDSMIDTAFSEIKFDYAYYHSKQLALKIFMNTFYGESGNKMSPLFMLELAGGITTGGQYNIKKVISHTETMGCEVVYGDTDSAYIRCPEELYWDLDVQYYSGKMTKIDYWTKTVEITFKDIKRINDSVNAMLIIDNGTKFLKTAYEEVLFPVAFLAKKKYYGIPHEELVNFSPKHMFIRGLELKKRGVPDILKKVCSDIMWKSLHISELRPLRHLVEDAISEVHLTKWEVSDFVKTGSYKPNKKNIAIHTFVRRMREERNIIIKPVERFSFVYVKKYPFKWDTHGRTIRLQAGDVMELESIAKDENLAIDLDKYVTGMLIGQFARLIVYHPEFNYSNKINIHMDDIEAEYYKNATAYAKSCTDKHSINHINVARVHQKAFRAVNKSLTQALTEDIQGGSALQYISSAGDLGINSLLENIYETLQNEIYHESLEYVECLITRLLKSKTIGELRIEYLGYGKGRNKVTGVAELRLDAINIKIYDYKKKLEEIIMHNEDLMTIKEKSIETIIGAFRENIDVDFDKEDAMDRLSDYLDADGMNIINKNMEEAMVKLKSMEKHLDAINNIIEQIRIQFRLQNQMKEFMRRLVDKDNSGANISCLPQGVTRQGILDEAMADAEGALDDVSIY